VVFSGKINSEWIDPWVLEAETIPDLELFGPVLVLKPFRHPEEAVHDLIQTRYGFLLAFFGSPPAGGEALFHEHFGMVFDAPDFLFMPLRLPFGGKKASGWILERRGDGWAERDGAFIYSRELAQDAGSSGAPGCTA
jgi:succinate-semialdehyde dehydrogenase/glutarate-semialdehyde dehydrogenase